jgi:hypothetical protein
MIYFLLINSHQYNKDIKCHHHRNHGVYLFNSLIKHEKHSYKHEEGDMLFLTSIAVEKPLKIFWQDGLSELGWFIRTCFEFIIFYVVEYKNHR